jgi:hypothetical protein
LHSAWKVEEPRSLTSKVHAEIRDILLSKCNKSVTDFKSDPKFCMGCIQKVVMENPHLDAKDEQECKDRGTKRKLQEQQLSARVIINTLPFLLQEERVEIAFEMGKIESAAVKRDHIQLNEEKMMHDIDLKEYISMRNPVVVSFINGLSGHDVHALQRNPLLEPEKGMMYSLCKTVESIMHYVDPNLLLPIHLRESILLYTTVGSRLALQIVSLGSGHASYQSVKNYVEKMSTAPQTSLSGDILAVFDNNQIFQRRWQVKIDNKFVCNVVTIVVFFQLQQEGATCMIQADAHFCTSEWHYKDLTDCQKEKLKFIDKDPNYKLVHNKQLSIFVSDSMTKIVKDQQWDAKGKHWIDDIDKKIQLQKEKDTFKKCQSCGTDKIDKAKRKCVCGQLLKKSAGDDTPHVLPENASKPKCTTEQIIRLSFDEQTGEHRIFSNTEGSIAVEKVQINVQQPVHVNPCSYEAVKKVLLDIGKKADVIQYNPNGCRQWLPIVCDGLPFGLGSKIIDCTYRCAICDPDCVEYDSLMHGFDEYEKHMCHHHPQHQFSREELRKDTEFKWVILLPGPGHVEMNLVKSFIELTWDIFYQEMVKIYGFTTDNALNGAKRVSDHHKAWTLLTIAREALTAELLLPYVRTMLGQDIDMSPAHFFKYIMDSKNPNYFFMADLIFELLDGIFLYRTGVREGDKDKMEAGRAKAGKLWFGRSHPMYRDLDTWDMVKREKMPPSLYKFVSQCLSIKTGPSPKSGEGPDFRLEEVNKQIQHILPNVPKPKDWDIACINHDKLVTLRDNVFSSAGVHDPKEKVQGSKNELSKEIEAFRILLRSSQYLLHPLNQCQHTSIHGNIEMDSELHLFCSQARTLRSKYVEEYIVYEGMRYAVKFAKFNCKMAPIFVTKKEREIYFAIENQSIDNIKEKIVAIIDQVEDNSMKIVFKAVFQDDILNMKGGKAKKADFIALYEEILGYLENEQRNSCMEMPSDDSTRMH